MAEASGGATANAAAQSSLNDQLHDAAERADLAALRSALAAGANVDVRRTTNPGGINRTPLGRVVAERPYLRKGATACVRALLLAGASPSAPITHLGGGRWMPLHEAAFLASYTVCGLLLDAGADVNVRDGRECTPLHYAAARQEKRNQKLIALLLSRGAVDGPSVDPGSRSPYLQKVRAAGSFANYEKQHSAKLVAMLAPKLGHLLPPELVSVVITFWAPVGLH